MKFTASNEMFVSQQFRASQERNFFFPMQSTERFGTYFSSNSTVSKNNERKIVLSLLLLTKLYNFSLRVSIVELRTMKSSLSIETQFHWIPIYSIDPNTRTITNVYSLGSIQQAANAYVRLNSVAAATVGQSLFCSIVRPPQRRRRIGDSFSNNIMRCA